MQFKEAWISDFESHGYGILPGVFNVVQLDSMRQSLLLALQQNDRAAIKSSAGVVYAARNVLDLWPGAVADWRQPPLPDVLSQLLGPRVGLVRGLYFDKPPHQSWALPWHKDITVAVREHRQASTLFSKPTTKAGVPHVEAPLAVLERMATARIHLDDVTEENGPLQVVAGSHKTGIEVKMTGNELIRPIFAKAGDVLIMRPLVAHCSGLSHAQTTRHRRILHLEFAAELCLPEGYAWFSFFPISRISDAKGSNKAAPTLSPP